MTALVKNISRLRFMRSEALRLGAFTPEMRDYLKKHKIGLATCIAHAGWLNVSLVKFWRGNDGDESFVFDPDGIPSVIIEAIVFDLAREPVCIDLVAWPLNHPEAFATAMGLNDGSDLLGPQNMLNRGGEPIKIWRTPLRWLQSGCDGCALLTPGARHWLRKAGGPFVVEDVEHGREIRDLLGRDAARHRILVPADKVGRAVA